MATGHSREAEGWLPSQNRSKGRDGAGQRWPEWVGDRLHTGRLSKGVNALKTVGNGFLTIGEST